ncbi:MAG: GNAT family N-acetyltransferase [Candidatus Eremiobacterota bacterium]
MTGKPCLFFRFSGHGAQLPSSGPEGRFWRPGWTSLKPPGHPWFPFGVWWLFDRLGVFQSREYGIMILTEGGRTVHRSCVFPAFYRFPFMRAGELQIGDTWTHPDFRGRGLALCCIGRILEAFGERTYWYVTEEDNRASIRVIEKAGFHLAGRGRKRDPLGLRLTARYELGT